METEQSNLKNKLATILIVEDRPMNLMLLEVMLNRLNHNVVCASNGREAWDFLCSASVDLVISDINMPEMSGFDLLEKIRSKETLEHLPIILMTSGGEDSLSDAARVRGADGFLSLPFSSFELKQMLDQFLVTAK